MKWDQGSNRIATCLSIMLIVIESGIFLSLVGSPLVLGEDRDSLSGPSALVENVDEERTKSSTDNVAPVKVEKEPILGEEILTNRRKIIEMEKGIESINKLLIEDPEAALAIVLMNKDLDSMRYLMNLLFPILFALIILCLGIMLTHALISRRHRE